MGDADKVRDLLRITRDAFLKEADKIDAEKPELYDLETEFAKTRKNKSLLVAGLVLGFVVLAAAVTVFLTVYIQNQNRKIPVDIGEFSDVNLRDLLSTARKNEDDLQKAQQVLQDAQQELQSKSQAVKDDITARISTLDAQGLAKPDRDVAAKKLQDEQAVRLATLNAQYAVIFRNDQATIDAAQKKIDAYDQKQLSAAKQQEAVLNNQQQLADLQLNQTKAYYEAELKKQADQYKAQIDAMKVNQDRLVAAIILKYNPMISADPLKSMLAAPVKPATSRLPDLQTALAGTYVDASVFATLKDTAARRTLLFSRLTSIPYQNSVPPLFAHLDEADRALSASYEDMATQLVTVIKKDEGRINALNTSLAQANASLAEANNLLDRDAGAFEYYARDLHENGFVINAEDAGKIAVFVAPSSPVADGDQGLVFRSDDEYIATLHFSVGPEGITAQAVEVAPNKTIEPFDKILIKRM